MASVITAHRGKTLDKQGVTKLIDELDALSEEEAKRVVGEHSDQ